MPPDPPRSSRLTALAKSASFNISSPTSQILPSTPFLIENPVVLIEGQTKSLTIFEECLKTVLGQFDHETIDTADIVQKLLFLENLNITYHERNIITKVQVEQKFQFRNSKNKGNVKFL